MRVQQTKRNERSGEVSLPRLPHRLGSVTIRRGWSDERVNARFNGNIGRLPSVCISEPDIAFVIRVGAGGWIANATVKY
jgi:hypothetical protein